MPIRNRHGTKVGMEVLTIGIGTKLEKKKKILRVFLSDSHVRHKHKSWNGSVKVLEQNQLKR